MVQQICNNLASNFKKLKDAEVQKEILKLAIPDLIAQFFPVVAPLVQIHKLTNDASNHVEQEERLKNVESSIIDAVTKSSLVPLYCSGVIFYAQDKIDAELQKKLEPFLHGDAIDENYDPICIFDPNYNPLGIDSFYFGEYNGRSFLSLDFSWQGDNNQITHRLSNLNEWIEEKMIELNDKSEGLLFTSYRVY